MGINVTNVDVATGCVRPQVFYRLNKFLDSQAYEMVVSCPVNVLEESTRQKCHAGFENENIADMIPVTSARTGISSVNKHCLICNAYDKNETSSFYRRLPQFIFKIGENQNRFFKTRLSILQDFQIYPGDGDNILFVPQSLVFTRRCIQFDVTSCNQTGL